MTDASLTPTRAPHGAPQPPTASPTTYRAEAIAPQVPMSMIVRLDSDGPTRRPLAIGLA